MANEIQPSNQKSFSALDEFHQWNEVTGIPEKGCGWYFELESILGDADKEIERLRTAFDDRVRVIELQLQDKERLRAALDAHDGWLANTGHGADHPWRLHIARALRGEHETKPYTYEDHVRETLRESPAETFNHERDCGLTNDAGTCECPQSPAETARDLCPKCKGHQTSTDSGNQPCSACHGTGFSVNQSG